MNLAETGAKLKKIRMEKGLGLEEVSKKTKVHVNVLRAIEGDSITNLSPIYLRSFIKIYCKFLGVEPKDFIQDYKEPGYVKPPSVLAAKTQGFKFVVPDLGFLRPSAKVKQIIVIAAAAALVVIFFFYAGKLIAGRKKAVKVARHPASAVSPKPAAEYPKAVQPQQVKPKAQVPSELNLSIKAKESCNIMVKADGVLVYPRRTLLKGRTESWKARDRFEIFLSNARAVELLVNGQVFSSLGRRGKATVIINKSGMKVQ